ncbi:MAG: hypothetical protein JWP13_902 [Candidatus Saccharibacteria bacterium]|nr:hypothetical protein [Candidatus Saccharibacteria bacterium]
MNSKRVSYIMIGALAALVLAIIGGAYAASTVLQKQADTLNALKLKHEVLEEEKVGLAKAKKDVEKYSSLERIAKTIVPQDKDQAETVREIVKLASDSGMRPSSITFPASTLGSTPGAKPTAGGASNLTQLTPVSGNPGLYLLPITISQDASAPVSYSQFINFLSRLEQNRRTAQVSSIVLQPSPQNRNTLSFTLTVDKYIKP